ncbi:hypothetical protein PSM96_12415 [Legionella pneumophila]|uniref:hypothetical protein n=1 Tax=Legionella pneumophila TaxID=446 RepID=UPI0026E0AD94|nr:hypothetical protein [Legionella pneumophila]MDO5215737.1 hypothetical protein [Legionella pneumophila]
MNIEAFFYGIYRLITEPVLAILSTLGFLFVGYYLKKPPAEGDLLKGLYPLIETGANGCLFAGFSILTLFVIIKIAQNR